MAPSLLSSLPTGTRRRSLQELAPVALNGPRRSSFQEEVPKFQSSKVPLRPLRLGEDLSSQCSAQEAAIQAQHAKLQLRLKELQLNRLAAAEQIGRLSRRELSEIKQLVRAPPEMVRRTLAATWILLHASRFRGKPASAVKFDDAKDWPHVKRMLAEGFVVKILDFDLGSLSELRHVADYVASHYLGLDTSFSGMQKASADGTDASAVLKTPSFSGSAVRMLQRSESRIQASLAAQMPEAEKAPLALSAVTRASEPCGALLMWIHGLLQEMLEREKLEAQVKQSEEQMKTLAALSDRRPAVLPPSPLAPLPARTPRRLEALPATPVAKPATAAPPPCKMLPPAPVWRIELDVTGRLASVRQQLSKCRLLFAKNEFEIDDTCPALTKVATIIKEHRGRLKLRLLGHSEWGEKDVVDLHRGEAALRWLTENAGVVSGLLRTEGVGLGDGCGGRCVVPFAIQELVPLYGPISPEVAANSAPVGLYFEAKSHVPGPEASAIISSMASWLREEESANVIIEGHGDLHEPLELSEKRADAVREALVRLGVAAKRLQTLGRGNAHPLSRKHAAPNRRAELHLQGFV